MNFIVRFLYLMKHYNNEFHIIVFWLGSERPSGHLFFARFTSFHTHASLLTFLLLLLLLSFGVRCARPGESENTLSPKTPTPHNQPIEGRKRENSRSQKRKSRSCQQESIGSALETRQSHIIKHRVTKIVPKKHREGHKGSAILRSPATRRRERVSIVRERWYHANVRVVPKHHE